MDTEALRTVGLGLSRLLRYSYGGFLLIVFASLTDDFNAKRVINTMSWELAAVAAFVIGAGIYATHRAVVVPVHHAILCLVWWLSDSLRDIKKQDSMNPTRWLGSIGVPVHWRISIYSALRGSTLFAEKEKEKWAVSHAESGLVLLTAEGLLLAAFYAATRMKWAKEDWAPLFWPGVVFLGLSWAPGFGQHAIECVRFRHEKGRIEAELTTLNVIGGAPAASVLVFRLALLLLALSTLGCIALAVLLAPGFLAAFPGVTSIVSYLLLGAAALGLVGSVGLWFWRGWAMYVLGIAGVATAALELAARAPWSYVLATVISTVLVLGLAYRLRVRFQWS